MILGKFQTAKKYISIMAVLFSVLQFNVVFSETIETKAKFAFVLNVSDNNVLFAKNANVKMAPASMSKLMTNYMVFEALKNGKIKLSDKFVISKYAFERRGSSMFAQLGDKISVDNLLQGSIVVSGNDASIALAEGLAGNEAEFAKRMQQKAKVLGLKNSTFANATGWPDNLQKMTAQDLGILAYNLINDFPEYYHYFNQAKFKWGKVDQPNRNLLLGDETGVDGLKTGKTEESGYGIVTSAKRGDQRVIVVLNGLKTAKSRARETRKIINWAFNNFKRYKIFNKNTIIGNANVAGGLLPNVDLQVNSDIYVTMDKDEISDFSGEIVYKSPLMSPIKKGQQVAVLIVTNKTGFYKKIPLYAEKHVAKGGRVDQSIDILKSWVDKKFNSIINQWL